jgi:predicted MPP superfamily phosphohydrolase
MRLSFFFAVPILVAVAAHAVLWIWVRATFPRARRWGRLYAGFVALLVLAAALARWRTAAHDGTTHLLALKIQTAVALEGLTATLAMLPIGLMHAAAAIVARLTRPAAAPVIVTPTATAMSRRQVIEAVGGLGFLATSGSMLGWGIARGRHAFEVDEVAVRIAGLPRALDGYTIAQVSDIHSGVFVGERMLDEGLSLIRGVKPDLLVVTGDIVDSDVAFAPIIARKIAGLAPRDGAFAIPGNHDHYAGVDGVMNALRAAGVTTLVNEARILRPSDGGGFALLGVDDLAGERRPGGGPKIVRTPGVEARILLSHQPKTVDRWAGSIALQLSGHTHGGQINPGFYPAALGMRYIAGRYDVGGTALYVNRGFGTVGPPIRVMAPPEVTKIVLVAA